ncbi:outer membrane beta-barrel protein [Iodobacter sp. HSC-16F04]|uniref:Outer membrane beta-barrel protein n=1 Tax=Iodobacter violaceini TaxID=3044271 RepID=A0ABX0KNC6_9NEIS|nr:outer membrane beta-barrel protein [Iodobacter violacea]NHQ85946.1 outer membrane beta-barrel protein [Iodobacter violacea]
MWFRVCLLGLCSLDYAQAAYGPEDTLKLNANLASQFDSNLFKLDENSENTQTRKNGHKADLNVETKVSGRLDLKLSRQLLHVNADVSQINYHHFSELNHQEWNAGLAWDWFIGSRFSGQLSATTASKMSSFEDNLFAGEGNSALDMQRQNSLAWQGVLQLKSTIAIIASAGISTEEHDLKKYIDAKNNTASLGLRYQTAKGNYISIRHGWRKYTYDIDLPFRAGFTEQTSSIDLGYSPGYKLMLSTSVGLSRWVSAFNDQSQNTPQWDLGLTWQATDKTTLKLGYGQSFSEFTSGAGRNLDQHFNANAKWLMTDKVDWNIEANRRERSFEVASGNVQKNENTNSLRLGLNYKALQPLSISGYAQAEQRNSEVINSNYKDYQLGLNVRFDY